MLGYAEQFQISSLKLCLAFASNYLGKY